jgi:uncharacterized membrane protein
MPDVYRAAPAIAERKRAQLLPVPVTRGFRWELLISFIAAIAVLVVLGVLLATLISELRDGWVLDHEQPMDKATAIHKLMFRP